MPEEARTAEPECNATNAVCDALRYVCDASYAVLPKDAAHKLGQFQKNFWSGVQWLAEKRKEWIDARVEGGDRLREEWERQCAARKADASAGSGI